MINTACVEGREREVCVKFWYRPHSHHTREQNTASSPMVSTPPTPQSTQALPPSGHFWAQLLPDHSIPMALWLVSSTQHQLDTDYMLYINTCARVNSALIFLVSCNFNDSTLLYPMLTTNIPESVTHCLWQTACQTGGWR